MKLGVFLAALLLGCTLLSALEESQIDTVMNRDIVKATAILQDKNIKDDEKSEKIFKIFDGFFDFKQMATICLGKAQWDMLNDTQKDEFITKFVQRLKESYVEKLKLYTDEKITIKANEKKSAARIQVPMILSAKDGQTYEILYKFYDTKDSRGWLIYDVDVVGISIVQTYRSQFDGVLKNGSFEDLIKKIDSINIEVQK
ncbi:MAG: ABC transporter substrate-binding protein [Campylobacteraceae bacterium]|jgi:phospholipid transport system substrate-binding protein|nr:ABC transporter substrate-binding protein [Campylobacteraceae bacterium]